MAAFAPLSGFRLAVPAPGIGMSVLVELKAQLCMIGYVTANVLREASLRRGKGQ